MFTLQILHGSRENSYYFIWRPPTPWKFQSFSLPFQLGISVNQPPEVYGSIFENNTLVTQQYLKMTGLPRHSQGLD